MSLGSVQSRRPQKVGREAEEVFGWRDRGASVFLNHRDGFQDSSGGGKFVPCSCSSSCYAQVKREVPTERTELEYSLKIALVPVSCK